MFLYILGLKFCPYNDKRKMEQILPPAFASQTHSKGAYTNSFSALTMKVMLGSWGQDRSVAGCDSPLPFYALKQVTGQLALESCYFLSWVITEGGAREGRERKEQNSLPLSHFRPLLLLVVLNTRTCLPSD